MVSMYICIACMCVILKKKNHITSHYIALHYIRLNNSKATAAATNAWDDIVSEPSYIYVCVSERKVEGVFVCE